jgi:hypothetical protein
VSDPDIEPVPVIALEEPSKPVTVTVRESGYDVDHALVRPMTATLLSRHELVLMVALAVETMPNPSVVPRTLRENSVALCAWKV